MVNGYPTSVFDMFYIGHLFQNEIYLSFDHYGL